MRKKVLVTVYTKSRYRCFSNMFLRASHGCFSIICSKHINERESLVKKKDDDEVINEHGMCWPHIMSSLEWYLFLKSGFLLKRLSTEAEMKF